MHPRGFASDNYAGAHPEVLAAVAAASVDHAPAYGADEWTARARELIRERLGDGADPYLVFNGTGANVVCLAALCRSWEGVICAESAHLNVDEASAPEVMSRVKLLTVPAPDGKLTPERCAAMLRRVGDEHVTQARVVSISQSTELGTVYSREEVRALADWAHAHELLLHVDGARIFNGGLDTLDGVDAVSLGFTKIGGLGAEAAVFLAPVPHAKWVRKQLGQLSSKQRFVAAQVTALLEDGLAERAAAHANAMARRLAMALQDAPGVQITQTPQANAVFAVLAPEVTEALQEQWRFYVWDEHTGEVRWMLSWDTTPEDVDAFAADVRRRAASG
jgi:threonine aldolase